MMAWRRVSHFGLRRDSVLAPARGIKATLAEVRLYRLTGRYKMMLAADMNWFAVLAHHATRAPDKAITVFDGEATTYGEMARRAAALAGGLSERGVRQGDVVGLLSYNCPEFLETMFATNYLGA